MMEQRGVAEAGEFERRERRIWFGVREGRGRICRRMNRGRPVSDRLPGRVNRGR
jgi:hypothetical protein